MKELSIEEKAKRYDKALTKARNIVNSINVKLIGKDSFEAVFPELKESGDEKIRKEIIDFVKSRGGFRGDWIAWLEKQGEQKTVVIIPKFRVGDEIKTANEEPLTITKIDEKGYWSEDLFICGFDDAAKWELVEQKSADLPNGEDYGIDGLYAAVDILQKTLGKVEGYQTDDGILEHECAISAVKDLSKQKPAEWSEEDERLFQIIIDILDKEEHKGHLPHTDLIACVRKLKFLRSQSPWKPSKNQIMALRWILNNIPYCTHKEEISGLLEQLEQL